MGLRDCGGLRERGRWRLRGRIGEGSFGLAERSALQAGARTSLYDAILWGTCQQRGEGGVAF
jgi:hypothetical protein